jgi:hypothetical protein
MAHLRGFRSPEMSSIHIAHADRVFFQSPTNPALEKLMSELSERIEALNDNLNAASTRLDKVLGEQSSVLADLFDVRAKLAEALANGQGMPPDVLASLNKAFATADAIGTKTTALDEAVVDIPVPG